MVDSLTITQRIWRHFWGRPPASGEFWADSTIVVNVSADTTVSEHEPETQSESSSSETDASGLEYDGDLYFTFQEVEGRRYIHRIPIGGGYVQSDTTGASKPITPAGVRSHGDALYRSDDGTWHYIYSQAGPTAAIRGLWHKYVKGQDPFDATPNGWSEPSCLTLDVPNTVSGAPFPQFVARADTVWAVFAADDSLGTEELFTRKGAPMADSVFAGQKMTWDGLVSLDRDFYVAPAGTLVVNPGTTIVLSDSTDNSEGDGGRDPSRIELIVGGSLLVNGTASERVTFRATDTTSAGGWYGLWFQDDEATDTLGVNMSSVSHADFWAPVFAMGVDSLSGDIIHCNFANSESADVYVAQDTRIPEGYQWLLDAPTDVVINDTDEGANWGALEEDSTRVEIFFEHSRLETKRPGGAAATDSVWFRSKAGSPASDDWFGIGSVYSTMLVEDASLGHAINPLYFGGADSAWLRNSTVHTFRDVGVFDWSSNAVIEGNTVEGSGGGEVDDRIGIHSLVAAGRIEGNTVDWTGSDGDRGMGISVEYFKSYCDGLAGHDSVHVLANTLTGPSETDEFDHTGLHVFWGCERRHPRIRDNLIQDWSFRGMHLQQCADTQVMCNDLINNWRGVYYTRNSTATGDSTRFYQNELLMSDHRNFETDWAYGVMLRDDYADPNGRGKNHFQVDPDTTLGSVSIYHSGPQTLDATKNKWITAAGTTTTDSTTIASMIELDGSGTVDHSTPLTNVLGTQSCSPAGALLMAQRGEAVADAPGGDDAAAPVPPAPEAPPESFALRSSFPNPVRSRVEIGYDVPVGYVEGVSLAVFDVTGRRVKRLVSGHVPPGRHRAVWSGRDEDGAQVAAGVYFVRLEARDFRRTTKVVLIR